LLFCVVMISRMGRSEMQAILATVLLALANWWWVRHKARGPRAEGRV
jgi:positive regulator of sigma E activity